MRGRYFVYILTNDRQTVLYVGVTDNLARRIGEHRAGFSSFTSRYNVYKLVYFEELHEINDAIAREKQIKGGSRRKKVALIDSMNPDWRDLSGELPAATA
jgi:putative endonuclease